VRLSGQAGAEKNREPIHRSSVVAAVRNAALAALGALLIKTPKRPPTAIQVNSGRRPQLADPLTAGNPKADEKGVSRGV